VPGDGSAYDYVLAMVYRALAAFHNTFYHAYFHAVRISNASIVHLLPFCQHYCIMKNYLSLERYYKVKYAQLLPIV